MRSKLMDATTFVGGGAWDPRARARLIAFFSVLIGLGCDQPREAYVHTQDHPPGHDHHSDGHGHETSPMVKLTHWTERYELFAEHPPLVVGEPASLLCFITELAQFSPLTAAGLTLVLEGPETLRIDTAAGDTSGIYTFSFEAPAPGRYAMRLLVEGSVIDSIGGLELEVFDDVELAQAKGASEAHEGQVELLKQQQWSLPFRTEFAEEGALVESIVVSGIVDAPPGAIGEVGAPMPGRLVAPKAGLPRPGQRVEAGAWLASLAPAPSSAEGAAQANLVVAEAEARHAAAHAALSRAERLIADAAISRSDLEAARREAEVAHAAMSAARKAADLFENARAGERRGSWRLRAPIAGTLTRVEARPGASVSTGDTLFQILDDREMWIRARVPEAKAAAVRETSDARYQVTGVKGWSPLVVAGAGANAALISVARTVDPRTRTVDVIYSLREPDPQLRIDGQVRVSVPTGASFAGIVVPASAVLPDNERFVVYVQVDGEHFEARNVRTGVRQGDRIAIVHGLRAGERIVTEGATLLRLADRDEAVQGHGHLH